MRIIMGVLSRDSGRVEFNGAQVDRAATAGFGYMPEERGLYPKMKVREQLVYLARLHGLGSRAAGANADRLLERLGLGERAGDKLEKLSLGNQQRAQIAAALVHDPTALILDEPFSGLDPMAVDTVMAVLREFADRGAPILFSSHQLDLVERITNNLVIIADGRIKAQGATADLREAHAGSRYRILVAGVDDAAHLAALDGVSGVVVTASTGPDQSLAWTELTFDATDEVAQAVLRRAADAGRVGEFNRVVPSLAEVFKEVAG
jgi:ABC-2 type transport system ATP-binding protein